MLYRYSDFMGETGVAIRIQEFKVERETDKTYFIKRNVYGKKMRQVRKGALRSFAYDTKDKAFDSYMARKRKQLWHAQVSMQTAQLAIDKAEEFKDKVESNYGMTTAVMGKPDFYENVYFD